MAEYRLEFEADSGAAERSIFNLKKSIKEVTKEFEKSEIGAENFIETASNLSRLKKELGDARNAVANIDKAYRDLNKAVEATFAVHTKATNEASKYHKNLLQIAENSFRAEDKLRDKNFRAEQDDWDRRLKIAVAAKNKIAAQEKAIMDFRAGMGARGAIPAIASPLRGGINFPDSPGYKKAMADAAAKAARQASASGGVQIPATLQFRPFSLAYYENQLKTLSAQARLIAPSDDKWKALNKEILKAERGIAGIQKRQRLGPTGGQRLAAAGGAFLYGGGLSGGAGSALGGVAGGLAGGVPGAFAGAAIGQVVDNLGTALAGITSQAAKVQQLQRGLALASIDAKDFAEAQAAVADTSARLFIPIEQVTKSFAQLRVNTKQYGMSVEETKQILEGTILAVSAVGGSAEDVDGAMRAVVQILSKGSVQAEELRGQLGERFPGAVVKFAQANKLSFEELQKGLEQGQIGIKEFVTFARQNYEDYAKFSERLATAPEFAGRRLQVALEQVSLAIGGLFTEAGADIQDTLTNSLNAITRFVKDNDAELKTIASGLASLVKLTEQAGATIARIIGNDIAKAFRDVADAAIVLRNMTGGGNISSVATERQLTSRRINEKFQDIADLRKKRENSSLPGLIDADIAVAEGELKSLQNRREELNKQFRGLGGNAAYQATRPQADFTFGGAGAGISMERQAKEDKSKKDSLEAFERLRDQLADAYNKAEIERIKQRYEVEKRLRDDLFSIQEAGANRLQRQNLSFIRALVNAERERMEAVMNARLKVDEAAGKVAGGATGAGPGGAYLQGNIGPTSTGPHFDVKKMGGGYFPRNYLDQYVQVNGRPLSAGTTVPGGTFAAHQKRNSHGWDYAFGEGRHAATLKGGAEWMGGSSTAHGEAKKFRLPTGEVFQFLHGRSEGIGAGSPRKVGSNEIRDTMAEANTEIAKQSLLLTERNAEILKGSSLTSAQAQYIADAFGIPDLALDNKLLKERNQLIASGVDEDTINYRLRLLEIDDQYADLQAKLPAILKEININEADRKKILDNLKLGLEAAQAAEKEKNDEILRGLVIQKGAEQDRRLALARAISPDQELRVALQQQNPTFTAGQIETVFQREKVIQEAEALKERLNGIASSISDSFGNAFKGIVTGSMTAREALSGFFQSVADSFADMVAKMIAEWLKAQLIKGFMNIFGSIAGGLGGGGSVLGGNSSAVFGLNTPDMNQYAPLVPMANGGVLSGGFRAFANGGIVTGPTLGLVGEGRYNEAVIPLPDGKSVPVDLGGVMGGMGGEISTNIVINVNNGQMQSEGGGNASSLGRKMEGAVKQVIVNELRPGGVLAGRR